MTSCFNRSLYLSFLRRFWPLWTGFALGLFLVIPGQMLLSESDTVYRLACWGQLTDLWVLYVVGIMLMAGAASMCVFGHLYFPRQTGLMMSLPVTRDTVYVSGCAAALSVMAGAEILVMLLTGIIEAVLGVFCAKWLFILLAGMLLADLALFGFAAFCAMLTGNVVVMPLVYLVLNFAAVFANRMVEVVLNTYVSGRGDMTQMWFTWASPAWQAADSCLTISLPGQDAEIISGHSFLVLGIYALVGIGFMAAGLWLHRRRRMESAGDTVAVPVLRPVFRYCMSLGCALITALICASADEVGSCCGCAAPEHLVGLTVWAIFGAAVGTWCASMIIRKSFRVWREMLPCLCISCAVVVMFSASVALDWTGFERSIPDMDTIAEAGFELELNGSTDIGFEDPDNIEAVYALHEDLITNRHDYARAVENVGYDGYCDIVLYYTLDNGHTFRRSYSVPSDSAAAEQYMALVNTPASMEQAVTPSVDVTAGNIVYANFEYFDGETWQSVTLSTEQTEALYAALLEDVAAGDFSLICSGQESTSFYDADLYINLLDSRTSQTDWLLINIPIGAEQLLSAVQSELGISRLYTEEEVGAAEGRAA